jgi:hypothetical protein
VAGGGPVDAVIAVVQIDVPHADTDRSPSVLCWGTTPMRRLAAIGWAATAAAPGDPRVSRPLAAGIEAHAQTPPRASRLSGISHLAWASASRIRGSSRMAWRNSRAGPVEDSTEQVVSLIGLPLERMRARYDDDPSIRDDFSRDTTCRASASGRLRSPNLGRADDGRKGLR